MTPESMPLITSAAALTATWEAILSPHGYSHRTLWCLVIGADDRPTPTLVQIDDPPDRPSPRDGELLGRMLTRVVTADERIAFLISRPGSDGVSAGDAAWAAVLDAAARRVGVVSEIVHRANDAGLRAVPLDELGRPVTPAAATAPW